MKNISFVTVGFLSALMLTNSVSFFSTSSVHAANLTTAKDTLQSSRLSFNGRVASPTVAGSPQVTIDGSVSGNFTSITTAGLKPGDQLIIGGTNTYTVSSIINTTTFTVTTPLASGDADAGDPIYYKAKPQHVLSFVTATAVNGGFFRVLIPAATTNANDGLADITGFDFASGVTATGTNATGYTFVAGVATASGGTNCAAGYHCFEFHYTGAGAAGTTITLSLGNTDGSNTMIAPAPTATHTVGVADPYAYRIQQFTNGSDPTATAVDDVTGRIALIEPVLVTATVDPSITFTITGIASAQSACGLTTSVATTNYSVPFGSLTINTFKVAAQLLSISTNAASGYAVTAVQNADLTMYGTANTIPATTCDSGTCSTTVGGAWLTAIGHPGFGYTMQSVSGTTINPTTGNFEQFPLASGTPSQIMSGTGVSDAHQANVCYQISVSASQAAGDYENQVTYTATASF